MSTEVTIERYAEIRAEMEAGRLRDDVLARAGLSVDEWIEAQRAWLDRVARELTRGRFELTNRYSQVFLDHQRSLATAGAAIPALAPTAAPAPALPLPTPAPIAPIRPVAPVISIVESAPAPPRVARPPAALSGTMNTDNSVFGPALPFQGGAAAPEVAAAPPPTALPRVNRAPAALTGTRGVDLSAALGPALPFAAGARPPPPAPPPPNPAPRAAAASPTPLGQAAGLDAWTVEHYASLAAEIAFRPAGLAETLARYRLTSELKAELDRRWTLRFAADPTLEATWQRARQTYLAFLGARRT